MLTTRKIKDDKYLDRIFYLGRRSLEFTTAVPLSFSDSKSDFFCEFLDRLKIALTGTEFIEFESAIFNLT